MSTQTQPNKDPEKIPSIGANIPPQVIPQPNLLEHNQNLKVEQNQEIQKSNSTLYKGNKTEESSNKNLFNTVNGFNPMNHIPPKYDIYGYLKPLEKRLEDMSVLSNKDKIKIISLKGKIWLYIKNWLILTRIHITNF